MVFYRITLGTRTLMAELYRQGLGNDQIAHRMKLSRRKVLKHLGRAIKERKSHAA